MSGGRGIRRLGAGSFLRALLRTRGVMPGEQMRRSVERRARRSRPTVKGCLPMRLRLRVDRSVHAEQGDVEFVAKREHDPFELYEAEGTIEGFAG